ncbi:MAG: DUF4167 domain-containing protein [Pseudomonadota bacterium]
MRSSKTRSRSKNNRNRSMGNIVNRVFDSSGPEGKVRGTPQQIIDKYNQLARDAQLSGDRVAFENFQQHSEHYTRMLSEAQREQEARREAQEREQEARREQQERDRAERQANRQQQNGAAEAPPAASEGGAGDVMDFGGDTGESGLVETPESKPRRRRRGGGGNAGNTDAQSGGGDGPSEAPEAPEAAE